MCGLTLKDGKRSAEIRQSLGLVQISLVIKQEG